MAKRRRAGKSAVAPQGQSGLPWLAVALVAASVLPQFVTLTARHQLEAVDVTIAFASLAGLVGAYLLIREGSRLEPTRTTVAWSLFLAWGFISMLASGRGWTAFSGEATALSGWGALALITVTGWSAGRLHPDVNRIVSLVAPWLVAFQCGFAIVQLLLGGFGVGTLPNSTYLGEAVLLLLPWVLVPSDARAGRDLLLRVGIALLAVAALGASGSRVAAVLGLIWAVWCFSRQAAAPLVVRRWAGPIAILLVAGGGLIFARSEVLGSVGVQTLGGRPLMWRVAALALAQRPVLGWGPDGFVAGGASVMTPQLAEKGLNLVFRFGTTDPHNLLVFIAVSFGVVGLGLFLWFVAEVVLRWRALRRFGSLNVPAAWAIALGLGVLLTAPPSPHILPLLGLVAGLSLAPFAERNSQSEIQRYASIGAIVFLGLASSLLGANAFARLPFEYAGPQVAASKAVRSERAAQLWAFDPHMAYLASLQLGFAAQNDSSLAARQPDLLAIRRAAGLDRRNPFYGLEYARTLGFYGADPELVEAAFKETLRRYPAFPSAQAEYGLFLAERGRESDARRHLAIARRVDDGDPEVAKAIEAAEKALGD